jgi:hypothetical protein
MVMAIVMARVSNRKGLGKDFDYDKNKEET